MSDESPKTTPDQDIQLMALRARLREWLMQASSDGYEHRMCVTALMLFASSGAKQYVTKDEFVAMMGRYYDLYANSES